MKAPLECKGSEREALTAREYRKLLSIEEQDQAGHCANKLRLPRHLEMAQYAFLIGSHAVIVAKDPKKRYPRGTLAKVKKALVFPSNGEKIDFDQPTLMVMREVLLEHRRFKSCKQIRKFVRGVASKKKDESPNYIKQRIFSIDSNNKIKTGIPKKFELLDYEGESYENFCNWVSTLPAERQFFVRKQAIEQIHAQVQNYLKEKIIQADLKPENVVFNWRAGREELDSISIVDRDSFLYIDEPVTHSRSTPGIITASAWEELGECCRSGKDLDAALAKRIAHETMTNCATQLLFPGTEMLATTKKWQTYVENMCTLAQSSWGGLERYHRLFSWLVDYQDKPKEADFAQLMDEISSLKTIRFDWITLFNDIKPIEDKLTALYTLIVKRILNKTEAIALAVAMADASMLERDDKKFSILLDTIEEVYLYSEERYSHNGLLCVDTGDTRDSISKLITLLNSCDLSGLHSESHELAVLFDGLCQSEIGLKIYVQLALDDKTLRKPLLDYLDYLGSERGVPTGVRRLKYEWDEAYNGDVRKSKITLFRHSPVKSIPKERRANDTLALSARIRHFFETSEKKNPEKVRTYRVFRASLIQDCNIKSNSGFEAGKLAPDY